MATCWKYARMTCSFNEIAASLILAIGTVKWYINSIYGKLHVKSRSQAIARSHELNLLD